MAKSKQTQRPGKQRGGAAEQTPRAGTAAPAGSALEELDQFIEKVLEEAGEEFLDEFRQIEGQ